MKRLGPVHLVACVFIVMSVIAILAPSLATVERDASDAKCQSNMRRWAQALQSYCADYANFYPMNGGYRLLETQLSPDEQNPDGSPKQFRYNKPWVESLYAYLIPQAKATDQDWKSFFRCPNAQSLKYPADSTTARMTYIMNYNLLQWNATFNHNSEKLMMLRESDRLVNSICRAHGVPVTGGFIRCTSSSIAPNSTFLTNNDVHIGSGLKSDLHTNGSNIVFADGHVKWFSTDFYPETCTWDQETLQWWNYAWTNPKPEQVRLNKTIAVTP